jgi:hypothetical protein
MDTNHIINCIISDPHYVYEFNEDQQSIELLIRVGSIYTNYLEANKKLLFNENFYFNLGFLFSKHGNRESLAWLLSAKPYPWDNRVLNTLAERGDFESFFWAQNMGCPWGITPLSSRFLNSMLMKYGLYDCVHHDWYNKKDFPNMYGEDTMVVLARYGRIQDIDRAISLGCPYDGGSCKVAMLHEATKWGRIDTFQWVMKNIKTDDIRSVKGSVWEFAFEDPQLRFMNWINTFVRSRQTSLPATDLDPACESDSDSDSDEDEDDDSYYESDEESENYSCGKDYARYVNLCWRPAVKKGNSHFLLLAINKIMYENSKPFYWDELLRKIAEYGQLHLARDVYQQYGHYVQSMMSAEIFSIVASTGKLDFLIWLRECECPWNEEAYEIAAQYGHIDIIRWLSENRCPRVDSQGSRFTARQMYFQRLACGAAKGKQLHVLKWIHAEIPLSELDLREVCDALHSSNHYKTTDARRAEIFKWLYEQVDRNFFR